MSAGPHPRLMAGHLADEPGIVWLHAIDSHGRELDWFLSCGEAEHLAIQLLEAVGAAERAAGLPPGKAARHASQLSAAVRQAERAAGDGLRRAAAPPSPFPTPGQAPPAAKGRLL